MSKRTRYPNSHSPVPPFAARHYLLARPQSSIDLWVLGVGLELVAMLPFLTLGLLVIAKLGSSHKLNFLQRLWMQCFHNAETCFREVLQSAE